MRVSLQFTHPGYIEDPYWPEQFKRIEIRKKSGIDRMRSEAKIRSGLESYLRSLGMTLDDWQQLGKLASRPFTTAAADGGSGEIIIPAAKIISCLVNACDVAPARLRIESLRSSVRATDFATGKTAPDGAWERFAVVKSGTGKTLSNQRALRTNQFIRDFAATGEIDVEAEMVRPEAVSDLLTFAGRVVGIGACRKMGYGRFEVSIVKTSENVSRRKAGVSI